MNQKCYFMVVKVYVNLIFCLNFHIFTSLGPSSLDILHGHSKATMLLICNNAAQGILSSFFFKYAGDFPFCSLIFFILTHHYLSAVSWMSIIFTIKKLVTYALLKEKSCLYTHLVHSFQLDNLWKDLRTELMVLYYSSFPFVWLKSKAAVFWWLRISRLHTSHLIFIQKLPIL